MPLTDEQLKTIYSRAIGPWTRGLDAVADITCAQMRECIAAHDIDAAVECLRGWRNPVSCAMSIRADAPGSQQGGSLLRERMSVRRLTPIECARLQGFPDDWGAGQSDSVCYRQYGNAVAVPVIEWIGQRLRAAANA